MIKWDSAVNPVCIFCNANTETRDHLFFQCDYTKEVWKKLMGNMLTNRYVEDWGSLIYLLTDKHQTKMKTFLTRYGFQVAIYSIWRERNERRHGGKMKSVQNIVQWIDKEVRNRLSTIREMVDMKYDNGYQVWIAAR